MNTLVLADHQALTIPEYSTAVQQAGTGLPMDREIPNIQGRFLGVSRIYLRLSN